MKIFGTHDEKTVTQLQNVDRNAVKTALMADGHLGYIMPIGGVAAYREVISPVGVGFDIACGNCAIKSDMTLNDLGSVEHRHDILVTIADDIASHISFGIGRSNLATDAPIDDSLFDAEAWYTLQELSGKGNAQNLLNKSRTQLGTVGSGNHYVDVFVDENEYIWVGVHFGSRGLGHGIASGIMALAQNQVWDTRVPETESLLSLQSELGMGYWELMTLAGRYAYAGREWVARKVIQLLGATETEMIHNHHNFAWKETHFGEELIVIRKGATPAFPNQKGFVGGSMGDDSVILEGNTSPTNDQVHALYSTVHGAGRVMSRTEARGKTNRKTGQLKLDQYGNPVKPPRVSHDMMHDWLTDKNVILRGGGVDESPHVYRRLTDVLHDQGNTVNIIHTLKPLIVCMAGENEFDPYKD